MYNTTKYSIKPRKQAPLDILLKHSINTYSEQKQLDLIEIIKYENRQARNGFILVIVILLLSSYALAWNW